MKPNNIKQPKLKKVGMYKGHDVYAISQGDMISLRLKVLEANVDQLCDLIVLEAKVDQLCDLIEKISYTVIEEQEHPYA